MMSLFAQDAPAAKTDAAAAGPLGNPLFFMVMIGIFMFTMLWLPSRRQRKEQAAMLASIKPGSRIVTASGIIGSIVSLKEGEDEIVIKSSDSKLKVTKASIVRVLGAEDESK